MRSFEPIVGTRTPVLLDRWDCATCLQRAARDRAFLITTGITSNRWLRMADDNPLQGWCWQKRSADLASVREQDCVHASWLRGDKTVSVPVVSTRVRKRDGCQVVSVRHALSAPLSQARFWASSDLQADADTRLAQISARWDREVLFADGKEERGLDHSQMMSARPGALLDSGDAGLRLSGGRTAPRAGQVATPGDHWRSPRRDPASSSSSRAWLAA